MAGLYAQTDVVETVISNLNKVIAGLGEENLGAKIDMIGETFATSSGDTANALSEVMEQYHLVNQALVRLAMEAKGMLLTAKQMYLDTDENASKTICGSTLDLLNE